MIFSLKPKNKASFLNLHLNNFSMMFEQSLKIDYDTIKALSVKKRLEIIELLSRKSLTLSEIADLLDISVATAKQHLDTLLGVELIEKEKTNRKWKYYKLTPKAKRLFVKSETSVTFALFASLILAIISFVKYISNYFSSTSEPVLEESLMLKAASSEIPMGGSEAAKNIIKAPIPFNFYLVLGIISSIVFVIILVLKFYSHARFKIGGVNKNGNEKRT